MEEENKKDKVILYLAREHTYAKKYVREEIEDLFKIINEVSDVYDEYLIVKYVALEDRNEVLAYGRIDHNKTKGRKR